MIRTIFLITSITITALAVAVPAAFGGPPPSEFEHGQGRPLGSPAQVDAITYFYANERATIPFPATIHDHGDATQAKLMAQTPTLEIIRDHGDATQAKLVAQAPALEIIRDHGDATQAKLVARSTAREVVRDHGDATQAKLTRLSGPVVARENSQRLGGGTDPSILRDHGSAEQAKLDAQSSGTTSVVESTSGWELDWSQLAIGFGVGMLLVLGLVAGVQLARNQRLAH